MYDRATRRPLVRAAMAAMYLFAVVVSAALTPFGAAQAHELLDPNAICSTTGTPPPSSSRMES